jgi:hypothetical protein
MYLFIFCHNDVTLGLLHLHLFCIQCIMQQTIISGLLNIKYKHYYRKTVKGVTNPYPTTIITCTFNPFFDAA